MIEPSTYEDLLKTSPTCRAMDPLSMTASIITVLELTTTLTGFINDVRHATREEAKVGIEASSIYSLLTSLRFWVEGARSDDTWFTQMKLLTRMDHLTNSKMFSKRW